MELSGLGVRLGLVRGAGLGWVCSIYIITAKPGGKREPNGQSLLTQRSTVDTTLPISRLFQCHSIKDGLVSYGEFGDMYESRNKS